jgi:hypothetical protein
MAKQSAIVVACAVLDAFKEQSRWTQADLARITKSGSTYAAKRREFDRKTDILGTTCEYADATWKRLPDPYLGHK